MILRRVSRLRIWIDDSTSVDRWEIQRVSTVKWIFAPPLRSVHFLRKELPVNSGCPFFRKQLKNMFAFSSHDPREPSTRVHCYSEPGPIKPRCPGGKNDLFSAMDSAITPSDVLLAAVTRLPLGTPFIMVMLIDLSWASCGSWRSPQRVWRPLRAPARG